MAAIRLVISIGTVKVPLRMIELSGSFGVTVVPPADATDKPKPIGFDPNKRAA